MSLSREVVIPCGGGAALRRRWPALTRSGQRRRLTPRDGTRQGRRRGCRRVGDATCPGGGRSRACRRSRRAIRTASITGPARIAGSWRAGPWSRPPLGGIRRLRHGPRVPRRRAGRGRGRDPRHPFRGRLGDEVWTMITRPDPDPSPPKGDPGGLAALRFVRCRLVSQQAGRVAADILAVLRPEDLLDLPLGQESLAALAEEPAGDAQTNETRSCGPLQVVRWCSHLRHPPRRDRDRQPAPRARRARDRHGARGAVPPGRAIRAG